MGTQLNSVICVTIMDCRLVDDTTPCFGDERRESGCRSGTSIGEGVPKGGRWILLPSPVPSTPD